MDGIESSNICLWMLDEKNEQIYNTGCSNLKYSMILRSQKHLFDSLSLSIYRYRWVIILTVPQNNTSSYIYPAW